MFDYRYHALSLAAVLFALALGVLIGVAIGDTNLVSSAKSGIVHNLDAEVGEARAQARHLQDRLSEQEAFAKGLYPLAVHELLNGRSVGLVFLGEPSDRVNSLVRAAITQGSGTLATVVAVRLPLDLGGIAGEAAGTHYAALCPSRDASGGCTAPAPELVERFGQLAGRQLVSGGALVSRELLSRVRGSLLSAFDGQLTHLEGLVVARTEGGPLGGAAAEADTRFEAGLLAGVKAAGVPAVGVELSSADPSQVPWFKSQRISSVDDLDAPAGQAAVLYALSGNPGAFGVKPTADSLLPTVTTSTSGP
jgi:Copper transport outer membrane protein, MctB